MRIVVFPYDPNPYESLLYDAMRRHDITAEYIRPLPIIDTLHFPVAAVFHRLRGCRILHIHWPSFYLPLRVPKRELVSWYIARLDIFIIRALRYRLVWTVHNVLPHEPMTSDDADIARRLSDAADAKIVLSRSTMTELARLSLDTTNVHVIPHGNYLPSFPERPTRHDARLKLKLGDSEFVVLFFGSVRPYKGIDGLLAAASSAGIPGIRVVVAGLCNDKALAARIARAQTSGRVDFHNRFIPPSEVPVFFGAADVVCLPFTSVTNSGSALLALSSGKPLVAPRMGALCDLPDDVGLFYDPADPGGLAGRLKAAADSENLDAVADRALAYAASLSWDAIGEQTAAVFRALSERRDGASVSRSPLARFARRGGSWRRRSRR